jgi:tight adherence protein B
MPLAAALDRAAIDRSAEEVVHTWRLALVVATILGLGLDGFATALGAAVFVTVGAPALLLVAPNRRARQIAASIPIVTERVAAELRAGGTMIAALRGIAASDSPLAPDIGRLAARVDIGASFESALAAWRRERRVDGVDSFAGALAVCARTGGPAADALEALATALRDRLAVIAEAHALSAQARLSAIVIGAAPLAYFAWSVLVDSSTLHTLAGTTAGRLCVLFGLTLELLGAWWMRRIVRAGSVW